MTLASKAHVKIGSYEFLLDETIDAGTTTGNLYRPHYRVKYTTLFQPKVGIAGQQLKESIRPERLLWFVDDFSGGENNRVWTPNDPTVYNYGYGANTRIKGQLTGRPQRSVVAVGANTDADGDVRDRPVFATAGGYLWLGGSNAVLAYSNSSTVWNELTTGTIGLTITNTDYRITAMAGDNNYLYYSAYHDTTGTNTGSRILKSMQIQSAGTMAGGIVQSTAAGKVPYAGLAMLQGMLYAWTGNRLWRIDVSDPTQWPLATTGSLYVTNVSGDLTLNIPSANVFGTRWWANCVATEHSVICFISFDGISHVYEYDLHGKGFVEIWAPDPGFTIKSMRYENGMLYMGGHWGGTSNARGWGALYAMKLSTREVVPVTFARRQNLLNLEMQEMSSSYGNTILVAASHTGRVWVYDASNDSFSMLDTMGTSGTGVGSIEDAFPQSQSLDGLLFVGNDHRIGDTFTFGPNRFAVVYRPGSGSVSDSAYSDYSYRVVSWLDDEPGNRQAATTASDYSTMAEFGSWDYDVPFGQKMLYGFDVTYAPLTTGQSFWIEYSTDGGALKTTTVYTSASSDAAKGRTFIDLTSTTVPIKFYELKFRIWVKATGNTILPPIIKGICAEAQVIDYDITFDLLVRVKQPQERTRGGTSATMQSPKRVRDYLKGLKSAKTPVTFLDGYTSEIVGIYDTYTVTVEELEDIVVRPGEGTMKVTLRTIPT